MSNLSDISTQSDSEFMKMAKAYVADADLDSSSMVDFDFSHSSPVKENPAVRGPTPFIAPVPKTKVETKVRMQKLCDIFITFGLYTLEASTGPVKANHKRKWIPQKFPITKQQIDVTNSSIPHLKSTLFTIADEVMNDQTGGMSALFQTANANKQLVLGLSISNHTTYGKGKFYTATEDKELEDFFAAVELNASAEIGIQLTMESPSLAAKQQIEKRSLAHAVLAAQNVVKEGRDTPQDELDHADPVAKQKLSLTALVNHHKALGNTCKEGYRLVNKLQPTRIMILSFEHMVKWAQILAAGTEGVTMDDPPKKLAGFKWESIKRSLVTTTPVLTAKRSKTTDKDLIVPTQDPWGYAEMQGMDMEVDLHEAKRLAYFSTIQDFVEFAKVVEQEEDRVIEAFEEHNIYTFYQFLFPAAFNARDMERWGIPFGTGLALMESARRFYHHLVNIEEAKLRSKGMVVPDSDSDGCEIKVMSSQQKIKKQK